MRQCIAAHTNPGSNYPGYVNFTREDDGTVTVHFRSDPSITGGVHIVGTPPESSIRWHEGNTGTLKMSAADFDAFVKELTK